MQEAINSSKTDLIAELLANGYEENAEILRKM
jgi:hypothetical protein